MNRGNVAYNYLFIIFAFKIRHYRQQMHQEIVHIELTRKRSSKYPYNYYCSKYVMRRNLLRIRHVELMYFDSGINTLPRLFTIVWDQISINNLTT